MTLYTVYTPTVTTLSTILNEGSMTIHVLPLRCSHRALVLLQRGGEGACKSGYGNANQCDTV